MISLGRTLLQDAYSSAPLAATFLPVSGSSYEGNLASSTQDAWTNILQQAPNAEEITKFFQRITPLKYSQSHQPVASEFSPSLDGLVLTAYSAGHTLGGTIWHIQHGMESIIHAVDWNQARENVIASAAWFGGHAGSEIIEPLRKPTALVCSATNADSPAPAGGRIRRDELLLDNIRSCLIKGGTVLIPSDSSARVLELAYILESAWRRSADDPTLAVAKVYMASASAVATLKHAQSLIEWMDDHIARDFEGEEERNITSNQKLGSKQINGVSTRTSKPFDLTHVITIERPRRLEKVLAREGPKVILASDASLSWGLSTLVLRAVARKPENLVLLTQKFPTPMTQDLTPAQRLWQILQLKEDGVALEKASSGGNIEQVHSDGKPVHIKCFERAALDAKDQQFYQQFIATQRQLQTSIEGTAADGLEEADNLADDSSSSTSSEDSDQEHQGRALNASTALAQAGKVKRELSDKDLGVNVLLRKKGVHDFDIRQFKRGRNAVFPYLHSRKRGDQYGEYIKAEDYLRAEEREENNDNNNAFGEARLGQKRKWLELGHGQDHSVRSKRRSVETRQLQGIQQEDGTAIFTEDKSDDSDDAHDTGEVPWEGPAKLVTRTESIALNARLAFVDFAGLHDQRSLQNLIELVAPRKLILTGATQQETDQLAYDCANLLAVENEERTGELSLDILAPAASQVVDASVDMNAWNVTLSHELVRRLQWQNVHGSGVATLTAQLKAKEGATSEAEAEQVTAKKQKMLAPPLEEQNAGSEVAKPSNTIPLLDLIPTNLAGTVRPTGQQIHVGDVRLADLRRLMTGSGHTAEFRGEGTLVIDGNVAVRKLGTGKVIVEGSPNGPATTLGAAASMTAFYNVKQSIYSGLAIIAGG